jgi:hypothetical protein
MNQEEQCKRMSQLIAKAWADENFKKKLLADPAATLKAEGIELDLPSGASLKVVQDTEDIVHFVLPARPTELSDEELENVAGGEDIVEYRCSCRASGCGGCRGCSGCGGCYSYSCRYCY